MGNVVLGSDGISIRQGIYQQLKNKMTDLGRFIDFEDGRRFRYCKSSGGLTRGLVCAAPTFDDHDDQVIQTNYGIAVGEKDNISVAVGAAPDANQYADGLLVVSAGSSQGEGQSYRIRKNTATSPTKIWLYDQVIVAIAEAADITLMPNKYLNVVAAPTSVVSTPIGVSLVTVTTEYYFWAQTRGYVGIKVDSGNAPVDGDTVMMGTTGTVKITAGYVDPIIGVCVFASPVSEWCIVDLHLE